MILSAMQWKMPEYLPTTLIPHSSVDALKLRTPPLYPKVGDEGEDGEGDDRGVSVYPHMFQPNVGIHIFCVMVDCWGNDDGRICISMVDQARGF